MRKLIIQLFMLYFLLLSSCVNEGEKKHKIIQNTTDKKVELPYKIELGENLNKTEDIPLSVLSKQLKYIVLETTPDCLLRGIGHIVFTNNYIFISDFNALFKFDIDGKFIQKIGKTGRGPGEYRKVFTFAIDEPRNKIYLTNYGIIQEYDFNGNYIRSIKIRNIITGFNSNQYIIQNSDKFIFHLANEPEYINPIEYSLIVTDTNAIPIMKFRNHHKRKSKPGITMATRSPLYLFQGQVRFMEYGADTMFTVQSDNLNPYAIFDLGRFKMNPDPIMPFEASDQEKVEKQLNEKLWIHIINEDNDYLYIKLEYGFSDSIKLGIFNKHDSNITFLNERGFINDLDGGIKFWPRYIYKDSVLVDYVNAYKFKAAVSDKISYALKDKYGEEYIKLIHMVGELKDESNPVLVIVQ